MNDFEEPSFEIREKIRQKFGAWWDEKVAAIAAEIKRIPAPKVGKERHHSTKRVEEPPSIKKQ